MWPYKNTFLKTISGKGDLYGTFCSGNDGQIASIMTRFGQMTGPFWVASTLIFVIAFAGNIVDYNNSYARGQQDAWRYDFSKSKRIQETKFTNVVSHHDFSQCHWQQR